MTEEKYEEFEYYWKNKKTIIFKPEFNDKLDNYYETIKNHKEIIFSDYYDLSETLKCKNNEDYFSRQKYLASRFNQEIKLPKGLESVKFGLSFNQEIELSKSLKFVDFGYFFNKKIELNDGLISVSFGYNFNEEIKLPESVKNVSFGYCFNKEIKLPESIENVSFGGCFNKKVKLPPKVEYLLVGRSFNKNVKLNKKLRMVELSGYFKLNLLGNSLERIRIDLLEMRVLNRNINYITNKVSVIDLRRLLIRMVKIKNLVNSVKYIYLEKKVNKRILKKIFIKNKDKLIV